MANLASERRRSRESSPPRVMLICSPGGHLMQMLALAPAWRELPHAWVTLAAADTDSVLAGRQVVYAHGPTNRSVVNLLRNLRLACRVVRSAKPDAMLSTGAGLAVPFFLIGRIAGVRLIYVESVTRMSGLSLTGRLVYHLCDRFFVQWPGAAARRRAEYVGSVL